MESSNNNLFFGNLFIGNNQASSVYNPSHVQARDNGANRWNSSYGNLWSDWLSPDANADGIVDVPYAIKAGGNMDNYPVTLTITNVTPNGAGVKINAKIVVLFSETMNASSVNIVVSNSVEGNITLEDKVATYTPDKLEYNKDYKVTVSGRDLAGNLVTKNWTFSTIRTVGDISGTIGNATGGPISGANVTLSNGACTFTNVSGYFEFKGVAPGSYNLTVMKNGYQSMAFDLTVAAGETNVLGLKNMTLSTVDPGASGSDNMVLIAIGIIAAIAVVAAVLVYMRRKPKKG